MKRFLKKLIPVIISLTVIFLLYRKIEFHQITNIFMKLDLRLLWLAIGISLFTNILLTSVLRYHMLKNFSEKINFKDFLYARTSNLALKTLLPLKSAEMLEIYYIRKKSKISFIRLLLTYIMIQADFLIVLSSFALTGFLTYKVALDQFGGILSNPLILFILSAAPISITIIASTSIHGIITSLIKRFSNTRTFTKSTKTRKISHILQAYKNIHKRKDIIVLMAYLTTSIILEVFIYLIIFNMTGININFLELICVIPIIKIISILPVSISGLGIREYFLIFFFSAIISKEILLSVGLIVFLIDKIIPSILSLFFIKGFMDKIINHKNIN